MMGKAAFCRFILRCSLSVVFVTNTIVHFLDPLLPAQILRKPGGEEDTGKNPNVRKESNYGILHPVRVQYIL